MRRTTAILTALALSLTAAPALADDPPATPFTDVAASHPFLTDIRWLAESGITTGFPDGSFKPGEAISREAFAAFLYRQTHGSTPPPACLVPAFDDVPASDHFCGHVTWLADTGITTGYPDGGFHPASQISREAVAAMLQRYRALAVDVGTACNPTRFRDLAGTAFCAAITWLAGTGLTTGHPDGTFRPSEQVTREAVAAYLHRFDQAFGRIDLPACDDFPTQADAQDWFELYHPEYGDIAVLDTDRDLTACESLRGPENAVECGETVTEDVTLVEDLECAGPGLVLTSGVTLDLGGHTVRYVGPIDQEPGTVGISGWGEDGETPIADVVVRNGTIDGYDVATALGHTDGLLLDGLAIDGQVEARFGGGITVRDSRIRGDLSIAESWAVTVQGNKIDGSIWMQAVDSSVVGNEIDAGGDVGIDFFEGGRSVIADNTIRSASTGILLAWFVADTEVRDNDISGGQVGIELQGYLREGNALRGNVITDVSSHGILGEALGVEDPLVVEENVVRNAGGDGIRFVLSDDSTFPLVGLIVSRNQLTDVLGHAVYAPLATGEGNVAVDVGTEPACVGPVCV